MQIRTTMSVKLNVIWPLQMTLTAEGLAHEYCLYEVVVADLHPLTFEDPVKSGNSNSFDTGVGPEYPPPEPSTLNSGR